MEEREYSLITTYFKEKYVSTIYRRASTFEPIWYFETAVFEWNPREKKVGKLISMIDSGMCERSAIKSHFLIVEKLNTQLENEDF